MRKLIVAVVVATGLTLGVALPAFAMAPNGTLHPACGGLLTANEHLADDALAADTSAIPGDDGDGIPGEEVVDGLKEKYECL